MEEIFDPLDEMRFHVVQAPGQSEYRRGVTVHYRREYFLYLYGMNPLASFRQIPDTEGDVIRKEKMELLMSKLIRFKDVFKYFYDSHKETSDYFPVYH